MIVVVVVVVDEGFHVVIINGHFEIQTGEFTQVTTCMGLFGTKDGSHFKDAIRIGRNGHLLVELGRLGDWAKQAVVPK